MPLLPIESIDDPRIAMFRNLRTTTMERKAGLFIAEGMWLVRRLLTSSYELAALLVDEPRIAEIGVTIPDDVPVYVMARGQVEKVVGFNFHRGIIAAGKRKRALRVADLTMLDAPRWTMVVLDQVQDPENVGSILRNCAAFGVSAVLLGPQCEDPFSRRVLRVAMGASFALPIIETDNLRSDLDQLRLNYGAQIAATVLDPQAEPLESVQRPERFILAFGSEGHGLAEPWWTFADRLLTIPMHDTADSLNVSVACGIFLHHLG